MHTRHRLVVLLLAAVAIALCVITSPTTQDQMGSNAETWLENFAKWHQGPLLAVVGLTVVIVVALPLRQRAQVIASRIGATIVLVAGCVKTPWILAAILFMDILSATGLAALGAVLMLATSVAIFIGTAQRPARIEPGNKPTHPCAPAPTERSKTDEPGTSM